MYCNAKEWLIRKKVEMLIRLTGFPLKTCGNDEQKQPAKIVILGLDPGIQAVFNFNTKDTKELSGLAIYSIPHII